jgi:hypothetical protein
MCSLFGITHNMIHLPLSRHEPWCLALREVPGDDFIQKGHLLREFIFLTRQLETMPESVVRGLLHTTEGVYISGKVAKG